MQSRSLFTVLLGLVLLPRLAVAQPPDERGRDRARSFLVVRIADALQLSDPDALKVGTVIRHSDEHREELLKQREGLEDKLRAALAKQPPDSELATLIAAGNQLDQQLALVPEDTFRELQKILTVEQQAKLLLFRRELQGEIRRAMQRRGGGGGRRRAPGGNDKPAAE
jgi:hypothetical protein